MARFSYDCSGLKCDFDGRASFDPDGSIVSYSWDFGDDKSGSGETTSHRSKSAGTFTVTGPFLSPRGEGADRVSALMADPVREDLLR